MDALGPLTTVPSASVEETKVKSPLVGENCMADSDNSSGFTYNRTHRRRSRTFTPLPRLTIPTDQLSDWTAGSKQSWRKQEVQKKHRRHVKSWSRAERGGTRSTQRQKRAPTTNIQCTRTAPPRDPSEKNLDYIMFDIYYIYIYIYNPVHL